MFRYTVNGEKFRSDTKIRSVLSILVEVKAEGAMSRSLNLLDHYLYSEPYMLGHDMYVNLEEANEFLILPNQPIVVDR